MARTLLVDNYDSFTYNLYHLAASVNGEPPFVIRNDSPLWRPEMADAFDCVIISPGPGRPDNPADFGICEGIIAEGRIPVLGICLGHQGIGCFAGARVVPAAEPRHGRISNISHHGSGLFKGIPSPFQAVRYHSLAISGIPETLEITAVSEDGTVMGIRHRTKPLWGVQFHPESICSGFGRELIANFMALSDAANRNRPPRAALPDIFLPEKPAGDAAPAEVPAVLLHKKIPFAGSEEKLFERFFKDSDCSVWLDSSREGYGSGRFSFLLKTEGQFARTARMNVETGILTLEDESGRHEIRTGFFDWLEKDLARFKPSLPDTPFEFALGWAGYIGYEMKAECGSENAASSALPDAFLIFATRGMVADHQEKTLHLLSLAPEGDADAAGWIENAAAEIRDGDFSEAAGPLPEKLPASGPFLLRHGRERYLGLVEECRKYILKGETYEVCLTNMAEGESIADPWTAYRMLRRASPAPFSAFLKLDGISVLSSSPERFMAVSRSGVAESKPIKGTSARSADPSEDRRLREGLLKSEKERAENLMIVDLVRHDLGRTAVLQSVHVPSLFAIESYATVHQMVSTVRSQLRKDATAVRTIRDSFPGGSMTGAPKIRTMQIIGRLEEGARGIYSGAIGYFSLCGAADLSIVIRTLVMADGKISFGTGGAVTLLSDAEAEFEEIRIKAKAFLDLFGTELKDPPSGKDMP